MVQLLHGIGEHAGRYRGFAERLVEAGYAVVVADLRGHGRTGLRQGRLGELGPRGMHGVLDSVCTMSMHLEHSEGGLPLVLLGHSWGSFLAQKAAARFDRYAALVLIGSTLRVPGHIARGDLNAGIADPRTPYDWLSRDPVVVDAYLADPWTGHTTVAGLPERERAVIDGAPEPLRRELPVLVLAGAEDPVGGASGSTALAEALRAAGPERVDLRLYPHARHELLNEPEGEQATADLLAWLDATVPRSR